MPCKQLAEGSIPSRSTVTSAETAHHKHMTKEEVRDAAKKATEYVMYLRVLLGQAMRAEAEALTAARDAARDEARGK